MIFLHRKYVDYLLHQCFFHRNNLMSKFYVFDNCHSFEKPHWAEESKATPAVLSGMEPGESGWWTERGKGASWVPGLEKLHWDYNFLLISSASVLGGVP